MDELGRRQRTARTVLVAVLLLLGLWVVHNFLPALIWAAVIAIAIFPLYERCEERCRPSWRSAALPAVATALVALVVLVPVSFGIVRAAAEAQDLMRMVAAARDNGFAVPHWLQSLPIGHDAAVGWWQAHLATPEATRAELARFDNATLFRHTQTLGRSLWHLSIVFFFTLLALFFVLREHRALNAQLLTAGHRLFGPSAERIGRQVVRSVRGTIDGLVLVGIGEGVVMTIAYVALGVPHPLLLGAATAVAAMIPFGAAVAFAIAALALLAGDAVTSAILVLVIGFTVVAVADHLIRPALIGGTTRLPFLWVLIGILGGVETLGLLGLFVGPATMAVLMMLWRELIERGDVRAPIIPG